MVPVGQQEGRDIIDNENNREGKSKTLIKQTGEKKNSNTSK